MTVSRCVRINVSALSQPRIALTNQSLNNRRTELSALDNTGPGCIIVAFVSRGSSEFSIHVNLRRKMTATRETAIVDDTQALVSRALESFDDPAQEICHLLDEEEIRQTGASGW
jgi:hypothetical protein